MKPCAYCGKENEDTATVCAECGTDAFKTTTVSPVALVASRGPPSLSLGRWAATRRRSIIVMVLLFGLPVIILLGIQVLQYCDIRFRHAVTVPLRIQDTNGTAQVGVQLRFRESGTRYLVPIPFTWSWRTKGIVHEITSDASGLATVSFREDSLYLEDISAQGHSVTNFVTVFHRHDGLSFTNRGHLGFFLHHSYYPPAKDPWRQDHTIMIR